MAPKQEDKGKAALIELKKTHKRTVSEECRSIKREAWICSICLELMIRPHKCQPCEHTFCEKCLQQLADRCPLRTVCPMCRTHILDCSLCSELDKQIRTRFTIEYAKLAEGLDPLLPLPGKACRRKLSVLQWLRYTLGNRENRRHERTDRVLWHFLSFVIMITVVICSFYLGHFIILASRYMCDYVPQIPVPNEIKLSNAPIIVIALVSVVVLIFR